jgi:hypothetical protein
MQTNFSPAQFQQVVPLTESELLTTGGDVKALLWDAAAFLVSPGFGFFYLGMKAGYAEAAD